MVESITAKETVALFCITFEKQDLSLARRRELIVFCAPPASRGFPHKTASDHRDPLLPHPPSSLFPFFVTSSGSICTLANAPWVFVSFLHTDVLLQKKAKGSNQEQQT